MKTNTSTNDIFLSKTEKKCIYAIKRFPHADIGLYELNGYLHFPPITDILEAIGKLKSRGLIEDKISPFHGLQLTSLGEDYIRKNRLAYRAEPYIATLVTTVIGGLIVAALTKLLGLI